MRNVKNIDWQRALTEGAVIVFSILLAFWIDAWWSQREEDQRVDSLLHALEKEWGENLERIDAAIPKWDEYIAWTAQRINASLQDVDSISSEELELIFDHPMFLFPFFSPSTGAWNAVVMVALSDVRDLELSSVIAAWPSRLERLTNLREGLYSITDTESGRAYTKVQQSLRLRINPESGRIQYDSDEHNAEVYRALLRDDERLILWRQALRLARIYQDELKAVRARLNSDLELLRSELDD